MKRSIVITAVLLFIALLSNKSFAQTTPAAATGDVVATLQGSDNGSVAGFLVSAANLGQTLGAAGPYTIFAPTNAALNKLPATKLDSLISDPTKLATVLKMHVVVGKFAKDDIVKALNASKDRKVTFKTVDGGNLTLSYTNSKLVLTDDKGDTANVLLYNLPATNGVVQGLDGVL